MTTHTGVTVTARVPTAPDDPRVALLERARASVDAPRVTYVVVRLDNHWGEHAVTADHLTVETSRTAPLRMPAVGVQADGSGLLEQLEARGVDPQQLRRLEERLADSHLVPTGRRRVAVYATDEVLEVEDVTRVLIPVEEGGPDFALFPTG